MSTRAQIMVKGSPVLVYKHSDGYPQGIHGVLHFLNPFVEFFKKYRGNDPSYFLAQLLRHHAVKAFREEQGAGDLIPPQNKVTGWGLDTIIHGGIEYLYLVNLQTGEVTVHTENFDLIYRMNKAG